ncbi:SMI1/KNR4 family protein [Nonomuraea sp. NPDC049607]|uniref:SMI1/KNR4 family protein n=1 Tax=Nonomuraea sp. NPDC049607 TaxID=3154732 RepID=UPI003423D14C
MNAPRYPWAARLHTMSGTDDDPGEDSSSYPPEWLGTAPASEAEILLHEERLGLSLPPSYREFLLVTNGWDVESFTSLHILPIAEAGWLRDVDPHLAHTWGPPSDSPVPELPDDYSFDYDAPQDPQYFEVGDFLPHTLRVSEDIEGLVYLLNPYVVTAGGEWEAWELDTSGLLGATRFRSFWHLMETSFRRA